MTKLGSCHNVHQGDYNVQLNFLPVDLNASSWLMYRRLRVSAKEERPSLLATPQRLPEISAEEKDWKSYWVLHEPTEGYDPFQYHANWSPDLSRRILFECLRRSVIGALHPQQYEFGSNTFTEEVSLIMETYTEGSEVLVVQPYVLKASHQIGFLLDFRFNVGRGIPFSRKVRQLSHILDKKFRRNVNYCSDRAFKVRSFLEARRFVFDGLMLSGNAPLQISKDFVSLRAERFRPNTYGKGLRHGGSLQVFDDAPARLLFVFREQDRTAARRLALGLTGLKQRSQHHFNELCKTALEVDPNPIVLPDLSSTSLEAALNRTRDARRASTNILPVIVLPSGANGSYHSPKPHVSRAGMPTQVCALSILEDEESLGWAVATLALQLFCKTRERPRKGRPAAESSLNIGISELHKFRHRHHVNSYFAFAILTDGNGLFHQIEVLGEATDHSLYIAALRANLKQILEVNAGAFSRVVIQTSLNLRAIQQTTREVSNATDRSQCRFSVVKVDHRNNFFGVNSFAHSFVPNESTKVRLGAHEYLVWPEGPTNTSPSPIHLQFLRVSDEETAPAEESELLQDLVNLSGADWFGFSAKRCPVPLFYCHLLADLVHNLREQGLPMPAMRDIEPWFL